MNSFVMNPYRFPMPCPPSYEELRFMQLDNETSVVSANLQRRLAEIPATQQLLAAIVVDRCTPPQLTLLHQIQDAFKALLEDATLTTISFAQPEGWPSLEDVERYERFATWITRLDQSAELQLCEARTLLYAHGKSLLPVETWLMPGFEQRWNHEMELHRLHREEDRAAAIAPVQQEADHYRSRLALTTLSPTQRTSAAELLQDRLARVARLQAIPIEALLGDRSALFK
jgi:hypothetical protein